MFGYININRKELKEESAKAYQSYYCGLCQKLKQNCGARGQMLLNYDMTFLVVLLTGLYEFDRQSLPVRFIRRKSRGPGSTKRRLMLRI